MSIRTDRVRAVGLLTKRADITKEQFKQYWLEHGALFSSVVIAKRNILKYEQMHVDEGATSAMSAAGVITAAVDGVAILEAESYEKILAIFSDEEYIRVVIPDEERFLDRGKTQVIFVNAAGFIGA